LLAAVFIIMNTFSMNVSQRRQQLAVTRAIGATRRQVRALVFGEALLLGVLGTAAGFAVGLLGARGLNAAMSSLFQTSVPRTRLSLWPMFLAAAFGLGISTLGAWLPARRAAQVTPLEGISGLARRDFQGRPWRQAALGLTLSLIAVMLLAACLAGWLSMEHAVTIVVLLLVSLVLLLPLLLSPLTSLSQWILQPFARVEARLARRQLLRHRGRTTLTVGLLFVAVGSGLGLANSVVDNVEDVRKWYRTAVVGDFFIQAQMPDMETGLSTAVPEGVGEEIRQVAGITGLVSVRLLTANANQQRCIVMALRRELFTGPSKLPWPAPEVGVGIGSVLAQRTGLRVGDRLTLESRDGPWSVPIAEVRNDYLAGGLLVRMDRQLADRWLGAEGVDAYIVKADHANLAAVETGLRQVCGQYGLLLQSYADLTRAIEGMMAGVIGSLWGLMVLGLIVAGFGVTNTLGMNVLEQTRELGLLRVVAMTPRQVRKTILAQAAMLGILGVVPGILAGVSMAYVINLATLPVIGHPVAFRLHPGLLVGSFLAASVMVLLAAWVPAERAARLEPAAALRYE
jgi:putative ABC transport system permease protein